MWTSCYSRVKAIPEGLEPVGISVGIPPWFKGRRELRLAPTRAMLKLRRAEYDAEFAAILARLDPRELYDALGDNAVLLCFEGPNSTYCHRRAVAEWFEQSLGVVVSELGFDRGDVLTYAELPEAAARPTARKRRGGTPLFP